MCTLSRANAERERERCVCTEQIKCRERERCVRAEQSKRRERERCVRNEQSKCRERERCVRAGKKFILEIGNLFLPNQLILDP